MTKHSGKRGTRILIFLRSATTDEKVLRICYEEVDIHSSRVEISLKTITNVLFICKKEKQTLKPCIYKNSAALGALEWCYRTVINNTAFADL